MKAPDKIYLTPLLVEGCGKNLSKRVTDNDAVYIREDLIKAEIERIASRAMNEEGQDLCEYLLSFISTLESGKPINQSTRQRLAEWSKTPEGRESYEKVASEMRKQIVVEDDELDKLAEKYQDDNTTIRYYGPGNGSVPEYNKTMAEVFKDGWNACKRQMMKDGLDAVKSGQFNKIEKTIAGVFVKYGMDRQKEIMSNGDYEKIKRLLSIAFMNYLDFNRPFGKMCLSNGECKNIDDAFDNQDWSELCRYADKMLKMNELGNGPFDKDYRPSGIQNDLSEGQIKAVELKGGTIVTEKLAKAIEKKSLLEKTLFEKALAAYHEKLKELPPPPSGYYYAPKMGKIRQEGDQYICDGYISLEPIIKVEEK